MRGSDPALDEAIMLYPQLEKFLQQDMRERAGFGDSCLQLEKLLKH